MEDLLIKAQLCSQEAENAMVGSNFLAVAEKFREAAEFYSLASTQASSTANRLQLEGFSQYFTRKSQEAENYLQPRGDVLFDYGDSLDAMSEESDSEDLLSNTQTTEISPTVAARKQTPSVDTGAVVVKPRSGSSTSSTMSTTPTSGSKPASLEEYAYAAQIEKHMSTSPLQALAIGFQTVRDLVLGPRTSPTISSPNHPKSHTPSLGESFIMVAEATSDASERERRLQEELSRVQNEFQKVQHMLDKLMEEQHNQQNNPPLRIRAPNSHASGREHFSSSQRSSSSTSWPKSSTNGSHLGEKSGMPVVAIAREAMMKQHLRENYLAGSDVHLSKTELESEIKSLREQLTAAERRNAEWAVKWDQVKQKALSRSSARPGTASMLSGARPTDPNDYNNRLQASTPQPHR